MDQEEIRKARLRTFCGEQSAEGGSSEGSGSSKRPTVSGTTRPLDEATFSDLRRVMVGDNVTADDLRRWYSQGFQFCDYEPLWGLKQAQGGPCGVLASVQAEIVKQILYSDEGGSPQDIPYVEPKDLPVLLSNVLVNILSRASLGSAKLVLVDKTSPKELSDSSSASDYTIYETSDYEEARNFLVERIALFQSGCGVVLFLMSLILTRGLQNILEDMDDPSNTMIVEFGHSSQDLLNLLLCGKAVSNVFDGDMPMGDSGLTLKGVGQQNDIGYLTQLEALRFCQVGSYYKSPVLPIWVVGSESHFTVLFSSSRAVNEQSREELLLARAQRAFKKADPDECSFIPVDKLETVLMDLDLRFDTDATALARLRGHLQIDGGNSIIFESVCLFHGFVHIFLILCCRNHNMELLLGKHI
jgi:ubiquitin carboxyl-terminal hydrolase MINDY-3/4